MFPPVVHRGRPLPNPCPVQTIKLAEFFKQLGKHKTGRRLGNPAFTLVEVMIAAAIMVVLAVLLLPAMKSAINSSRMAQCANNLRQIASAIHLYAADNHNRLPQTYVKNSSAPDNNWFYHVYPYLNNGNSIPYNWTEVTKAVSKGVCHCPAATAWNSYKINMNFRTLDDGDGVISLSAISLPSRILMIAEGNGGHVEFNTCASSDANVGLWYPHRQRLNGVFLDGHIEQLSERDLQARWSECGNFNL